MLSAGRGARPGAGAAGGGERGGPEAELGRGVSGAAWRHRGCSVKGRGERGKRVQRVDVNSGGRECGECRECRWAPCERRASAVRARTGRRAVQLVVRHLRAATREGNTVLCYRETARRSQLGARKAQLKVSIHTHIYMYI